MHCPLCFNKNIKFYLTDKVREYWQCSHCELVFVKPEQYITKVEEKALYDNHENSANDRGYRKFLNKLALPLMARLSKDMQGLDFGCGPGPTLSVMFEEQGFKVKNYDIFYANDPELLQKQYHFITCTEVIEHLHHPYKELTRLTNLLEPIGLLGIMTKRVIDKDRFKTWHYKNDLTHVCFYSDNSFEFIAEYWNYNLNIINSDTVILTKL